jgi:2-polyprenyl-3-methyl-5-hydroxy-6-metoxy-1,4-benzoquinol methylase
MALVLPRRELIEKSSEDDPLEFYYRPVAGLVYRRRLAMGLSLLGPGPFGRLLEIGYGSGILFPELARRAREVHGLDIHPNTAPVEQMLRKLGIAATLRVGDIYAPPYDEESFDAVVCLSVMEHLTELDKACAEVRRILAPGGVAAIGFPVRNALTTALFRSVGYDAQEIHPSSHRDIVAALGRAFAVERVLRLPPLVPMDLGLYAACRCRKA